MIITIDGHIATGKSTIAKKLAEELGFIYFDTGAMYRGIAWLGLKQNIDFDQPEMVLHLINDYVFEIKNRHGQRQYWVNKEDVTNVIRNPQVTAHVSKIAADPNVRKKLLVLQREFAMGVNAVFEGRDMGTVVFPNAEIKIFLTARPDVRAKRRFDEFKTKFPEETQDLTLEMALKNINERDYYDSTRTTSPLKQAVDAIVIDTSDLSIDEVVMKILEIKDALKTHRNHTSS